MKKKIPYLEIPYATPVSFDQHGMSRLTDHQLEANKVWIERNETEDAYDDLTDEIEEWAEVNCTGRWAHLGAYMWTFENTDDAFQFKIFWG